MIPHHILAKLGKYEIEVEVGVKVKANVIDRADFIDENISELRSLLGKHRLVGIDVKVDQERPKMIVLCVGNRCLIIHLCHLNSYLDSLHRFLIDGSICFVGTGMKDKVSRLVNSTHYSCNAGVEISHLATRILKEPEVASFTLARLAKLVGIELASDKPASSSSDRLTPAGAGTCPADWTARVYTGEEIKYVINDACTSYAAGNKLLDSLDANPW